MAGALFLGLIGLIPDGARDHRAVAARPLTIGFIYVGPKTDYGYNQAHAEGAAAIAKLPGVKIREEEMVPETSAVQKTMESMINLDGATLLFPTSFGYFDPHILKEANKYKNVTFLHCGGLYQESKHPTNVGSYFGYIDEAQYVAGIVAGLTTKSNKLGFVAAKPIPQVLRNINSYTLGARSVNPKLSDDVTLLIASNPCFGLDFAAVAEIRSRLVEARNRGAAVLLISADLDEIFALSDRIVVISEGKAVHETPIESADLGVIGRHMAGHA